MLQLDFKTFRRKSTKRSCHLTFPIHIALHNPGSVSKYWGVRGHVRACREPGPGCLASEVPAWCSGVAHVATMSKSHNPPGKRANITPTADPLWPWSRCDENLKTIIFPLWPCNESQEIDSFPSPNHICLLHLTLHLKRTTLINEHLIFDFHISIKMMMSSPGSMNIISLYLCIDNILEP